MASCTRIDGLMQASLDGELSAAEKVVFEQHVLECSGCSARLKAHQRASAAMYEALAPYRLSRSLRQNVLENLPELTPLPGEELVALNWRAKRVGSRWTTLVRRLPLVAAIVLIGLGAVIHMYWPQEQEFDPTATGVVTYVSGGAFVEDAGALKPQAVHTEAFVSPGGTYATGPDSKLMLSLMGPTLAKMGPDTRLRVDGERLLTVEYGDVWLDVNRDGRRFIVRTPSGDATVLGTSFMVSVRPGVTTVTVESGEVCLDTPKEGDGFVIVSKGQQASIREGGVLTAVRPVEIGPLKAWSEQIQPDQDAHQLFVSRIVPKASALALEGKPVFWVPTSRGDDRWAVSAIRLTWEPVASPEPLASYDIYVYDEQMRPLFKDRIQGIELSQSSEPVCEISVPNGPIDSVNALIIRLVPDYSSGKAETVFEVSALAM